MSNQFTLDPRLEADTEFVVRLPLCDVRLMNDARFAWLILVPRRAGAVELSDLDAVDQTALWQEAAHAGAALRVLGSCDKLNIGVLGNIVRQLHVHLVARRVGDAAWPGPVWGQGTAMAYTGEEAATIIAVLQQQAWLG